MSRVIESSPPASEPCDRPSPPPVRMFVNAQPARAPRLSSSTRCRRCPWRRSRWGPRTRPCPMPAPQAAKSPMRATQRPGFGWVMIVCSGRADEAGVDHLGLLDLLARRAVEELQGAVADEVGDDRRRVIV